MAQLSSNLFTFYLDRRFACTIHNLDKIKGVQAMQRKRVSEVRNDLSLLSPFMLTPKVSEKILEKATDGLNWGFQTYDGTDRIYFERTEREGLQIVFKNFIDSALIYLTQKETEKEDSKADEHVATGFGHILWRLFCCRGS